MVTKVFLNNYPFFALHKFLAVIKSDFLVRQKGKRLMVVGDSMNQNQFESILCVLHEGLKNKRIMYEIHGHKITKGRATLYLNL